MHRRLVLVGVSLVLLASATAAPSSAATSTPYSANFPKEQTVFRPCPPGTPPGAICFTGSDHSGMGTSDPPGGAATEDFAGFVDTSSPGTCPNGSTGFHDHNAVAIGTSAGKLFLTTSGLSCGGMDTGTWQAVGGTGMFANASGGGMVQTQAGGGTGSQQDPIRSSSTYTGQLTLE